MFGLGLQLESKNVLQRFEIEKVSYDFSFECFVNILREDRCKSEGEVNK